MKVLRMFCLLLPGFPKRGKKGRRRRPGSKNPRRPKRFRELVMRWRGPMATWMVTASPMQGIPTPFRTTREAHRRHQAGPAWKAGRRGPMATWMVTASPMPGIPTPFRTTREAHRRHQAGPAWKAGRRGPMATWMVTASPIRKILPPWKSRKSRGPRAASFASRILSGFYAKGGWPS